MKTLLIAATCLLLARTGWGQDAAEVVELEKFKGYWKVIAETRDGVATPKGKLARTYLHFSGNRISDYDDDAGKERDLLEFTLHLKVTPRGIDFRLREPSKKGGADRGIYRFEGKKMERLEFCIQEDPKGDRPTEFSSPEGSKRTLLILERVR